MKVECDECNGTGECCYSCCGGDIITGDILMCPTCHEHLGEEPCQACDGTGEVEEDDYEEVNKIDLVARAEFMHDLKQDR